MKTFKHSFDIGGETVELEISKGNIFKSKVLKGSTGTGDISGGNHTSVEDFIASVEKQHKASHKNLPKVVKEVVQEKPVRKSRKKKD